ncbi:lytic polysaccharide monooxygenase [Kribbella sp. NPDC023855]|uniref:lytic polysaccharide monooxygenase n=1 Tax=Kribbella sp. NPDC023855 TaxID=3154698 RepID=UPI00340DAB22
MTRKKTVLISSATAIVVGASCLFAASALGHGSMQSPASRTYTCFLEGAESPDSAACKAAIALGGTQAVYDWNEVNIANAGGRHRELIPDGKLCSANRSKYQGFDLARADWPATTLPSGGSHTFSYRATAAHRGSFELYLTRPGFNPAQPLRWADLELFHRATDPPLTNGAYQMNAVLPVRSGRHLVYSIWQRSDSQEAFYTCSDVTFGTTPTPTPTPTPTVTPTPTPTPTPTATPTNPTPAWAAGTAYPAATLASYNGRTYRCLQGHTAQPGWEPPNVPALWQVL